MRKLILTGTTLAGFAGWVWAVSAYNKWNAGWFGWLNAIVFAAIFAVIVIGFTLATEWFQAARGSARPFFFGILTIGFVLAIFGGVYFTEPITPGAAITMSGRTIEVGSPEYYDQTYRSSRAGGFYYYYFGSYGSSSAGSSSGSSSVSLCSGKDCGTVLMIAFVAVVLACCFIIPHFWVAGSLALLAALLMITIREWRVEEEVTSLAYATHRRGYSDVPPSWSDYDKPKNPPQSRFDEMVEKLKRDARDPKRKNDKDKFIDFFTPTNHDQ